MIYIIAVTIDGKEGLVVSRDGSFIGSENEKEAIESLPDYRESHSRGYESSMSAVIYQMFFRYHVIEFKDIEEIKRSLKDSKVRRAHHVSGNCNFVHLKDGYKPTIIHTGKFLPTE